LERISTRDLWPTPEVLGLRTSMDCVNHTRVGEAPELVPPFLGVAVLILGIIVIDEMRITNVFIERLMEWCVGQEVGELVARCHNVVSPIIVLVGCSVD
jgi:hypothetical protein